jgi:DNA-binding response OmpR family regulator
MGKTTLPPKKILIIEDEGDMCLLLNLILTGKEMELDHVKNLAAAADYLKTQQPDAVLLDNKLPDGFGVDFISYLRHHYPSIKVIMISGYDGSVKDVALHNGADAYLEKPFTKEQIYQAIKGVLQGSEAVTE